MDEALVEPGVCVRPSVVSDAPAIVALGRAIDRDQLATEDSFRALLEQGAEPPTERLVAELDGRIIARAPSGIFVSGAGWFWIGVEQQRRRRGLGGHLYAHIEARLSAGGATRLETSPNDEDGRGFLLARGFEIATVARNSELDPRSVVEPAAPPARTRVVSLGEASAHADALYRLYADARADVPSGTPRPPWTYVEWRRETVDSPLIDPEASVVVLEDEEPVALAWLYADREGHRAEALMTATRRDRRGRGLATLAKVESARRAAALGITRILTGNDLDNAPMLAINGKLGVTETAVCESYAKRLG